MTHDPLEALLRLRRAAVDEARRGLAQCLRVEGEAAASVSAIDAAIERETEVASSLATGDAEVESFALWLRRIRPKQRAAQAAELEAGTATARARAVLGAARAAVRAVETTLEKHAAAAQAETERRAQAEIDEVALQSSASGVPAENGEVSGMSEPACPPIAPSRRLARR